MSPATICDSSEVATIGEVGHLFFSSDGWTGFSCDQTGGRYDMMSANVLETATTKKIRGLNTINSRQTN